MSTNVPDWVGEEEHAPLMRRYASQELEMHKYVPSTPRNDHTHSIIKRNRFTVENGEHQHYIYAQRPKKPRSKKGQILSWLCFGHLSHRSEQSDLLLSASGQLVSGVAECHANIEGDMAPITRKYGQICQTLGVGACGVVLLSRKVQACDPQLDRFYAIKVFRRGREEVEINYRNRVTSDFSIASSLHHWNVIHMFELLSTETGSLCECMEYCSGGDLHSLVVTSGYLKEAEADCFFKQLLHGVSYIHEMGVAHRDLKPENLLLSTRGCLKISDFGSAECFRLAWEEEIHLSTKRCGSAPYISPEQYHQKEFDPRSVDIWAAALIYIAMRTGRNLWKSATSDDECFRDFVEDRMIGRGYFLIEDLFHVQNRRVLYSMLDIDNMHRPMTTEVLASEWLQRIVTCRVLDQESY